MSKKKKAEDNGRSGVSVGVYFPLELCDQITARGKGRSAVVSRDLERYYALLKSARARVTGRLEPLELEIVAGVLKDKCKIEPFTINLLPILVRDAPAPNEYRTSKRKKKTVKGNWDTGPIADKLDQWTLPELFALKDAVERYWLLPESERTSAKLMELLGD